MKVTVRVYVVATYHRWGDELRAFGSRAEAEAFVMEYAREFWDSERLGRFPRSYSRLYDAWGEHDLWGSVESRWELEACEVELPNRKAAPVHAVD
jgi:hypothetical protein